MSTQSSSLRVAIVGSGPAGFYAAEALQKGMPGIAIDLIDRLPTPFGLVRGGVPASAISGT
jgi:ferredoxin--NADP+ reductase